MKLSTIIRRFKWKFSLTMFLVLTQAVLEIFFPLFIGYAIDDAINQEYQGAFLLGGLGLASLIIGACQRFFDSRFYGSIFEKLGFEISQKSQQTVSKKTARLNMMREILEFFENSIPELVSSIIGLVGALILISTLNLKIFWGCLIVLVITFLVYWLTTNKTIRFNTEYNNETESQVDIVTKNRPIVLKSHLRNLMRWNIKLSDLETVNFSAAWFFMMGFLVWSIIISVEGDNIQYGSVFALVMYIFQYIDSVMSLPFFYQQWLRLREILERLKGIDR